MRHVERPEQAPSSEPSRDMGDAPEFKPNASIKSGGCTQQAKQYRTLAEIKSSTIRAAPPNIQITCEKAGLH
ncbi:hypothetical protein MP213Fo_28990 [Pseudochrobactrum sp. MP213Fo]